MSIPGTCRRPSLFAIPLPSRRQSRLGNSVAAFLWLSLRNLLSPVYNCVTLRAQFRSVLWTFPLLSVKNVRPRIENARY